MTAITDDHRRPPPLPFAAAPVGICRLCGGMTDPTRPKWHADCATQWNIANDPKFAREFVFSRDAGECVDCGCVDPRPNGKWDVDHGVPLRDCPRELRYWLPANLFTRCDTCHVVKTVAENAARRLERKRAMTKTRPTKADKRRARQEEQHEEFQATQSPVQPKTPGQKRYFTALKSNGMTIALGPAGTGKTYLATCLAAQMYKARQIRQIILVRPAVEAGGEKHGFLPGKIEDKLAPWAAPIINILKQRLGDAAVKGMISNGQIRIEPFTYMRGLTFDDAFVILDEAQNTTVEQMKLFTTRIGENTKVVIDGDIRQTDLTLCNGLQALIDVAHQSRMEDVAVVRLTNRDIVRSKMTAAWVAGWDAYEGLGAGDNEMAEDHGTLPDFITQPG